MKADDFRVRTNAALALGQSGDDAAVAPLCAALSDSSDVVRQAVAVALQRLAKPAAAGCLKDRLGIEPSDAVKREIGKALEALSSGGGGGGSDPSAPTRSVANAKYYVAVSAIANQTGRSDDDIARIVGAALRGKLEELGGYQIAPDKESPGPGPRGDHEAEAEGVLPRDPRREVRLFRGQSAGPREGRGLHLPRKRPSR